MVLNHCTFQLFPDNKANTAVHQAVLWHTSSPITAEFNGGKLSYIHQALYLERRRVLYEAPTEQDTNLYQTLEKLQGKMQLKPRLYWSCHPFFKQIVV